MTNDLKGYNDDKRNYVAMRESNDNNDHKKIRRW